MTKRQLVFSLFLVCILSIVGGIIGGGIFVKHPYFSQNEPLKLREVKSNIIASKTIECETLSIFSKDKSQRGSISFLIDSNGDPFMVMYDHQGNTILKIP